MGRLVRLWTSALAAHTRAHWSSPANFWSGVIGMIVNNALALGTIYAMLFAGRPELKDQSYAYAMMTLVNMSAWGIIHILLGGWVNLDVQINEGALDSALMTPRSPLAVASIAASYLPAWGDLIMGVVGLFLLGVVKFGFIFLLNATLMVFLAASAFAGIFISIGSLGFFARRSDRVSNSIVMMIISFNSYPIFDALGSPLRWLLFLAPVTAVGVIPARYLLSPTLSAFCVEALAAALLVLLGLLLFRMGLRRYQSTPSFTGQRG